MNENTSYEIPLCSVRRSQTIAYRAPGIGSWLQEMREKLIDGERNGWWSRIRSVTN